MMNDPKPLKIRCGTPRCGFIGDMQLVKVQGEAPSATCPGDPTIFAPQCPKCHREQDWLEGDEVQCDHCGCTLAPDRASPSVNSDMLCTQCWGNEFGKPTAYGPVPGAPVNEYDGPPDGDAWSGGFAKNH